MPNATGTQAVGLGWHGMGRWPVGNLTEQLIDAPDLDTLGRELIHWAEESCRRISGFGISGDGKSRSMTNIEESVR